MRILRDPASLVAVVCVAVALGVTAMTSTLVDASVLRPFGLPAAKDLVVVWEAQVARPNDMVEVSLPTFLDWERTTTSMQSMAAFGSSHWPGIARADATPAGASFSIAPRGVSRGFFRTLGVTPLLGRDFSADDLLPAHDRPVMLSHALWQRQFAAAPDVVGRTLYIDNKPHRIVGVMPRGFAFPDAPDAWVSVERVLAEVFEAQRMSPAAQRMLGVLQVIARYETGVDHEQARSQLDAVQRQLATTFTPNEAPLLVVFTPFTEIVLGRLGGRVWIALAMTVTVLLFACANVSTLRAAQLQGRAGELAARLCLGASRPRLFVDLIKESTSAMIVSAIAATGVAMALEWWLREAAVMVASGVDPATRRGVTYAAIGVGAVSAWMLTALPTALAAVRRTTPAAITTGSRTVARGSRVTSGLLLAQSALAVCLVAMAAGAFHLFASLAAMDVGFATRGVTALDVSVPDWKYETPEARAGLERRIISALQELPGVTEAAGVSVRPFRFGEIADGILVRRAEDAALDSAATSAASRVVVSAGYFEAMGINLHEGRLFTATDRTTSDGVAIVTRSLARAVWRGESAVGRRLAFATLRGWIGVQVVGVVEDVRSRVMITPALEVYVPARAGSAPLGSFVARHVDGALTNAIARGALASVDSDLVLDRAQTTGEVIANVLAPARLLSTAMTMLGATGLVLLTLGIFGAAATLLRAATREVGIRQAIGATPFMAARAPLRMLLTALGGGLAAGSVAAPGALSGLAAIGVAERSGLVLALVVGAAAVALSAGLAIAINVRRTTSVSPAELLRTD